MTTTTATAQRKPLGIISRNGIGHTAPRKYQKTCVATTTTNAADDDNEEDEEVEDESASIAIATHKLSSATSRARVSTKTVHSKKVSTRSITISELSTVNVRPVFNSDSDEPSSEASPREPAWFMSVPQKHRQAMKSMLDNTMMSIPPKQRDIIVHDCCSNFTLEAHVQEFLDWLAAHEHLSSLTTRLNQTAVWSPIPSATSSLASSSPVGCLYTDEIYDNLLAREKRFAVIADYMETVQRDITHHMRSILVDWLVEVGEEYKLSSQTLFLAVNYIDRLLGIRAVNRHKLQLVGITCMLVAAKYEEIYPPTIQEFVYISDNTYSKKDVLNMESILLTSLQFNLSAPTPWEFARGFCNSASIGDRPKFLANFFAELFMMFPCSLKYRPSIVAASAVFLALYTLHLPPWPTGLLELAGNNKLLLLQCAEDMHAAHTKVISEGHALKAVREKFQESKWLRVSLIPSRSLDIF